jgi:hypothetical protein
MTIHEEQNTIEQLLDDFEKAIGKKFHVIIKTTDGEVKTNFADVVLSIDRELQIIEGNYGTYPAVWCRLKQEQPAALKNYSQQQKLFI